MIGIQLFRERLSYKRGKAYATMTKVMGNGGFYGCLSELKEFHRGGSKQHNTCIRPLSFLVAESPGLEPQSSKAKLLLPIMPNGIVAYAFTLLWDNPVEKAVFQPHVLSLSRRI